MMPDVRSPVALRLRRDIPVGRACRPGSMTIKFRELRTRIANTITTTSTYFTFWLYFDSQPLALYSTPPRLNTP